MNIFSLTLDAVHYTRGRSGRALLHHSVEDEMQFAVDMTLIGMHFLLQRSLAAVFQVQDILEMPLNRSRVLESDSEKEETESDKQWTDSTQSEPCAPLIIHIYRRWKGASASNQLFSTSQLRVQNSDHWPQEGK
jgi:hypothetical protein